MKKLVLTAIAVSSLALTIGATGAQEKTISVVVKDTTSPFWQTVMAGACVAGKDLGATDRKSVV